MSNGTFVSSGKVEVSQARFGGQAAYNMGMFVPYAGLSYIYDFKEPNQAPIGGIKADNDRDGMQGTIGIRFSVPNGFYGGLAVLQRVQPRPDQERSVDAEPRNALLSNSGQPAASRRRPAAHETAELGIFPVRQFFFWPLVRCSSIRPSASGPPQPPLDFFLSSFPTSGCERSSGIPAATAAKFKAYGLPRKRWRALAHAGRASGRSHALKPMVLNMAIADRSGAVAYLGRPCQYLEPEVLAGCDPALWMRARFSEDAVAAMDRRGKPAQAKRRRRQCQSCRIFGGRGNGCVDRRPAQGCELRGDHRGTARHRAWTRCLEGLAARLFAESGRLREKTGLPSSRHISAAARTR
jgi:hypothetical protein